MTSDLRRSGAARARVLAATLVVAAALAAPASAVAAPATIDGLGHVTPPGCAPGALHMPISWITESGDVWASIRAASIGVECPAIVYGTTYAFAGRWNPELGGCIDSISHRSLRACLGPVPHHPTLISTTFALCFGLDCWPGRATVVRA